MIAVRLNERLLELPEGTTLAQLRAQEMPDADVAIRNGHPANDEDVLADGDCITLIQRGRTPSADELEALLVARHTPGVHEKMKTATVGVAGLGGLGSAVAIALARVGVGQLVLVDFDVVEPSNLNRQQYFIDQLGLPKVEALSQTLQRINPYVTLETKQLRLDENNAQATFAGCDVVVECFDDAEAKAMLARTLAPHLPVVAASGVAGDEPADQIRTRKVAYNLYVVGDQTSAVEPGRGLMAPRVGVAAHHQANAVLRLLLGKEPV